MNINQVIKKAKHLSRNDRALLAHCLIYSLEERQDDSVDQAWADLAEKRYEELMSGKVESVSWEEIKKVVKG